MTKLTIEEVFDLICKERAYQDAKWGPLKNRVQSLPGFLVVLEDELEEAKRGWLKNVPGRDACLPELVQVAAVAVAALMVYGGEGNG